MPSTSSSGSRCSVRLLGFGFDAVHSVYRNEALFRTSTPFAHPHRGPLTLALQGGALLLDVVMVQGLVAGPLAFAALGALGSGRSSVVPVMYEGLTVPGDAA